MPGPQVAAIVVGVLRRGVITIDRGRVGDAVLHLVVAHGTAVYTGTEKKSGDARIDEFAV